MCSQGLPLTGGAPSSSAKWTTDMRVRPSGTAEVRMKRRGCEVIVRVDARGAWSTRMKRDKPGALDARQVIACTKRAVAILEATGLRGGRAHVKEVARSVVGK